jgi:nicotinamide mononucleotide transporter
MTLTGWMADNWIEIFGAVTGIIYVFLEIRQSLWLWPVGIITSAVYVWVFFHGKLYADMSLQCYYLVISVAGWYWWGRRAGQRAQGPGQGEESAGRRAQRSETMGDFQEKSPPGRGGGGSDKLERDEIEELKVTRIKRKVALVLLFVFAGLYTGMFFVLNKLTDSPVPGFDAFLTSLSIVATWMLARKIYEHWYLWIIVNFAASVLFLFRGLYPTVILYTVFCIMSFAGLREWKKSMNEDQSYLQTTGS